MPSKFTKPTALNCFRLSCDAWSRVILNGRILHPCGECGIDISSIISCPKEDPTPAPVKKKQYKPQSNDAQTREIKKSYIIRGARKEKRYDQKITDLLKEYK